MTATAYIVLARIAGGSRLSLSVHIKEKASPFTRNASMKIFVLFRTNEEGINRLLAREDVNFNIRIEVLKFFLDGRNIIFFDIFSCDDGHNHHFRLNKRFDEFP